MYNIEVLGMKFRYVVGSFSVGIVSSKGKKHTVGLDDIRNPEVTCRGHNGSSDDRLTPSEVAAYVLKNKLFEKV